MSSRSTTPPRLILGTFFWQPAPAPAPSTGAGRRGVWAGMDDEDIDGLPRDTEDVQEPAARRDDGVVAVEGELLHQEEAEDAGTVNGDSCRSCPPSPSGTGSRGWVPGRRAVSPSGSLTSTPLHSTPGGHESRTLLAG